jgi:hypothetical protein
MSGRVACRVELHVGSSCMSGRVACRVGLHVGSGCMSGRVACRITTGQLQWWHAWSRFQMVSGWGAALPSRIGKA